MNNQFIPVSAPDISSLEKEYACEAIESTWISSTGKFVDRFENLFAAQTGNKYCLAASSGTTALHLALLALGIKEGDEVIVPSLTYIASVNAISYCGAKPVFVDVDRESWCISPSSVIKNISSKTKAVMSVHLYGQPAAMDELSVICKAHNLYLIEDAAEALFAKYQNQPVGSLSDIAIFSFYGNKLISSGEGGAVVTNNKILHERARLYRGQGMDPSARYYFPVIGYNYRLTNVSCAILCAQIERKDRIIEKRRRIYEEYNKRLEGNSHIELQKIYDNREVSPWLYTIIIHPSGRHSRDGLADHLKNNQIETRPIFYPIHHMPPYMANDLDPHLPNTLEIAYNGISLPTHSLLEPSDLSRICDSIADYLG